MIEDKDFPAAPKTGRETIERWHALPKASRQAAQIRILILAKEMGPLLKQAREMEMAELYRRFTENTEALILATAILEILPTVEELEGLVAAVKGDGEG